MTDSTLTHVYFLLDRSGSMQSIKLDTEGGFASFVEQQRDPAHQGGTCRVTLAQFDNDYDVVYRDVDISDVPALDLQPRGCTALLDAIGQMVTDAGVALAALPDAARPGTVIVAVMTDGHENASREWSHAAIKTLVEQQTAAYGWQFMYMGADQDAIEVGTSLGVAAEHSITYGRGKSREAMTLKGEKVRAMRDARMVDPFAPLVGYTEDERSRVAD